MCAVSSWHMSGLGTSFDRGSLQDISVSYYVRALSELNAVMLRFEAQAISDNTLAETVLLTSTFLCKYEIIKGGVRDWRSHLDGTKGLLGYFRNRGMQLTAATLDFATSL